MADYKAEIISFEDLKYIKPKIAVIGATIPDYDYKNEQGEKLGYALREIVEDNKGLIFTGGVAGVGVDVARGIVNYVKQEKLKPSRFFVSFPENCPPAEDYFRFLSEIDENLRIIPSGKDMLERRQKLAEIADMLIVVNGGAGTMDEANRAYDLGKPLYCLNSSGGVARQIAEAAGNDNPLIQGFDSLDDLVNEVRKI